MATTPQQLLNQFYCQSETYLDSASIQATRVQFDSGEIVELTRKELIYNLYLWYMFIRDHQVIDVPIVSSLSVHNVVRKEIYPKNTHVKLLQKIFSHIKQSLNLTEYRDFEYLTKQAYETTNLIYNNLVQEDIAASVVSTDIFDFVEMVEDPFIKEVHQFEPQNASDINRLYKLLTEHVENNMSVKNSFVLSIRSKCLASNKAMQCLGPRGVIADIDTTVYRKPAQGGFIRGLRTLYDLVLESRAMAKSLMAQNLDVSTSQYASRRSQFATMTVEKIVPGDCGSQTYYRFTVGPKDLKSIVGMHYLKSDNTLDYVQSTDEYLIGETLNLRVPHNCELKNPHHICSTCYGRSASSIPDHSNIGHISVAELMTVLTQNLLSLKHLLISVSTTSNYISDTAQAFFVPKGDDIFLKPGFDRKNTNLLIPYRDMAKIVDLMNIQDDQISPVRIGEFTTAGVLMNKGKTVQKQSFEIISDIAKVVLSRELVMYIKQYGYSVYGRDYFNISLEHFDLNLPIFNVPAREAGLIQFVNKVIGIIDRNVEVPKTADSKLSLLHDTVNSRLDIHICLLSVIVYAMTAKAPEVLDYRLARGCDPKKTVPLRKAVTHRTLGPLLVFEKGTDRLFDKTGEAYVSRYNQGHPMDVFFLPNSVKDEEEGE